MRPNFFEVGGHWWTGRPFRPLLDDCTRTANGPFRLDNGESCSVPSPGSRESIFPTSLRFLAEDPSVRELTRFCSFTLWIGRGPAQRSSARGLDGLAVFAIAAIASI